MSIVNISEAARITGKARTTIQRKIKSGHISAVRQYDGSRGIDTSELVRVFGELHATDAAIAASDAVTPVAPQSAPAADLHRAADDFQFGGAGTPSQMELVRLRVRNEALEAENSLLREQLGEAQADKRELFKLVGNDRFRARGWWASVFGKD